jgi:hypothetical protein
VKGVGGALTAGTTPTLTPEQTETAIEAYAKLRPSRTAVADALRRLAVSSSRDAQVLLKIWLDKVASGDWPTDEPRKVVDFVDQQGVRYLQAPILVQLHDGTIRQGYRNCAECNGNGWHHKEYPNGTTTAGRCQECQRVWAEYIRERRRKEAATTKRGSSKEAW